MVNETDFVQYLIVQGLSSSSVKLCRIRIHILNQWLTQHQQQLTKQSVESFLFYLREGKQLNNNSLNNYIFLLHHLKNYLKDRGQLYEFLEGFKLFKKVKPVITILTPEEIEKILTTYVSYGKNAPFTAEEVTYFANLHYGIFTRFLATTGSRFAEAALLQKKHIDISYGTVTFPPEITKTGKHRRVFLDSKMQEELTVILEGKKDTDRVFTNIFDKPIIPQNYALYLERVKELAGISKRLHPHIFRHSFATQLIMSGVDVTMVASLLGHSDIQTTYDNYVHLADMSLKKAQFKHPLLRKSLSKKEVIAVVKEAIETAGIDDERFDVSLTTGSNNLSFHMICKG